jgi:hypothetical protein
MTTDEFMREREVTMRDQEKRAGHKVTAINSR